MRPIRDREKLDAVMEAVSAVDLKKTQGWMALTKLSKKPIVEGTDAVPEGIFEIGPDKFTAAATVYVALTYGTKPDAYESANSFPSLVTGHFDTTGKAKIDSLTIDTSSFSE